MDRLIAPNSVSSGSADTAPVSGTPQYATDGNPASGIAATQWPAYQYNAIQEELIAILTAAGVTPDRTKLGQIAAAIPMLIKHGLTQYTSSTTLTVPAGVYWATGRVRGGGGGGGGSAGSAGAGSGGGGSPEIEFGFAVAPGDTIGVTIGAAGASNGGGGGSTIISHNGTAVVTSGGGLGGVGGNAALATTAGSPGTPTVASGVSAVVYGGQGGQLPFAISGAVLAGGLGGAPGNGGYSALTVSGVAANGASGNGYGGAGGGGLIGGNGGSGIQGYASVGWG